MSCSRRSPRVLQRPPLGRVMGTRETPRRRQGSYTICPAKTSAGTGVSDSIAELSEAITEGAPSKKRAPGLLTHQECADKNA